MTFLSRSLISEIMSSAMEITASAGSQSVPVVPQKKVFILFNVEKQPSDSAAVIGVVNTIFKNLIVSEKASYPRSSEDNEQNKSNSLLLLYKSCIEYKIMNLLLSFLSSIG